MKLTLTYEGRLSAKKRGVSVEKAAIRKQLHPQIKSQMEGRISEDVVEYVTEEVGDHSFISPVHPFLGIDVELDILLLTPVRKSPLGDLDNRLKTLLDGLTRPVNTEQLKGHSDPEGENLTYCLLDDDSRVKRIGLESRVWHLQRDADYALVVVTATLVKSDDGEVKYVTVPLLF